MHIQSHCSQVVLGGDEGERTRHSDGAARPHEHLATLQGSALLSSVKAALTCTAPDTLREMSHLFVRNHAQTGVWTTVVSGWGVGFKYSLYNS